MGIFSKIKDLFKIKKKKKLVKISVVCNKCQKTIDSVFRKNYDFQPTYGSEEYDYSINKELVCPDCYSSINLKLKLDQNLEILNKEINGGKTINAEE